MPFKSDIFPSRSREPFFLQTYECSIGGERPLPPPFGLRMVDFGPEESERSGRARPAADGDRRANGSGVD